MLGNNLNKTSEITEAIIEDEDEISENNNTLDEDDDLTEVLDLGTMD